MSDQPIEPAADAPVLEATGTSFNPFEAHITLANGDVLQALDADGATDSAALAALADAQLEAAPAPKGK